MRVITLTTAYLNLVKRRLKVQTIRKNSSYYAGIATGDIGYVTNYRDKIKIRVLNTYIKYLQDVTEEEAMLDGFSDKIELLAKVKIRYGVSNFLAKIIRFQMI